MLALLEPCVTGSVVDTPDLGCAMLLAACQEKGIPTKLIRGQTRFIKNMFLEDCDEIWDLIDDLKQTDLEKLNLVELKRWLQEIGKQQFHNELRSIYQYAVASGKPRHVLNGSAMRPFHLLFKSFIRIYTHYVTELNHTDLLFIHRYVSEVIQQRPSYIGVSLWKGTYSPLFRAVLQGIKSLSDAPVIVGGPLTSRIYLERDNTIFAHCNYMVLYDGESTLPLLIETLEDNREPQRIPNVFYRKEGRLFGEEGPVMNDIIGLPYPDFSQFDLDHYLAPKRILPIQTARGCTWGRCAFCSHLGPYGKQQYRSSSTDKIVNMLRYLKQRYQCYHFAIQDEELPPSRAGKISRALLRENLGDIRLYAYGRLVEGYDDDRLVRLLYNAGFRAFKWGLESGNQRVLNLMRKGTDIKTISSVLTRFSQNRIANCCYIVVGFPGETIEEFRQTIDFVKAHKKVIMRLSASQFKLSPNSGIAMTPEKWGLIVNKDGRYESVNGMGFKEAARQAGRVTKMSLFRPADWTSGEISCVWGSPRTHFFNTLCFLCRSYGLMTLSDAMQLLEGKELKTIYPVVLGELDNSDGRLVLKPINTYESALVNATIPLEEQVLDGVLETAFELADGTNSIEEIINISYKRFMDLFDLDAITEKCLNFFCKMLSRGWALAFEKSWAT